MLSVFTAVSKHITFINFLFDIFSVSLIQLNKFVAYKYWNKIYDFFCPQNIVILVLQKNVEKNGAIDYMQDLHMHDLFFVTN